MTRQPGTVVVTPGDVASTGSAPVPEPNWVRKSSMGLAARAPETAMRWITVNAVSPGFIDTDMTAAHVQGENRDKLLAQIPLGRMGTADEIAHLTAFLCGPRAAYITGQVLRVNGGLLM